MSARPSPDKPGCATAGNGDDVGALLTQIAGGDQNSLALLYAETSAEALRCITAVLLDTYQAEEVTQEVYLQLWLSAAAAFDPALGTGRNFVLGVARRRAIDRVRTAESARRRDASWTFGRDTELEFSESSISRLQIQAALRSLGERAQTVIAVYYHGKSYKEIAEQLGITVITVKNRHHRALVSLRELISS